jgi:hypothetical protein
MIVWFLSDGVEKKVKNTIRKPSKKKYEREKNTPEGRNKGKR